MERFERRDMRTPLRQSRRSEACPGDLPVIVVEIAGMVRENSIRRERLNLALNKLHQRNVRHGVQANIRKIAQHRTGKSDGARRIGDVFGQFEIARPLRAHIHMPTQQYRLDDLSARNELRAGSTEPKDFIIGVRRDNEVDDLLHRASAAQTARRGR
jgi:hypothetical protein